MPKSAVVDASVLVSAFLFPDSVPGRVVKAAHQAKFTLHLMTERYGDDLSVPDWHKRLVCSACGSRQTDFVVTGAKR